MRRIARGDVHRRGGAALIGEHGRKISRSFAQALPRRARLAASR